MRTVHFMQLILPLTTPFIEKKRDIDRSTLYGFKGSCKLLHVDIADLRFLAKSAVDPKYFNSNCLLNLTIKKRLQTDQRFQENGIKRLNASINLAMFSAKTRCGKAIAAEQNIN